MRRAVRALAQREATVEPWGARRPSTRYRGRALIEDVGNRRLTRRYRWPGVIRCVDLRQSDFCLLQRLRDFASVNSSTRLHRCYRRSRDNRGWEMEHLPLLAAD